MNGKKEIKISNRFANFKFVLNRNITIVRGDSGTGKTTLFNMIADYTRNKDQSGVNISSPCDCVAIIDSDWKAQIRRISESIVFVDEDYNNNFLNTKDFARIAKNSNNYYVLFTREDLHDLPYSIEEIYAIKSSGKIHKFEKIYKSQFTNGYYLDKSSKKSFNVVMTEDSKSGFQFFKNLYKDFGMECVSSGSNSAIYKKIQEEKDKKYYIIADGAAFGSEIDKLLKLEKSGYKFCIYLPESFEWIILKSGLIEQVSKILDDPADYIDSK